MDYGYKGVLAALRRFINREFEARSDSFVSLEQIFGWRRGGGAPGASKPVGLEVGCGGWEHHGGVVNPFGRELVQSDSRLHRK